MNAEETRASADTSAFAWYASPRAVFCGGNEVQLLRKGAELFPQMLRAIAYARHEIWLATYVFNDDAPSLALVGALVAASRRGVRVRVVVDGFGSLYSLAVVKARLDVEGVAFAVFRPMRGWRSALQPGLLRRLHQKLCVVDGDIGFVGGINIIDDRYDLHHGWHDVPRLDFAVRLRGPIVARVEQTVRAVWTRAWFGRDWREEIASLARDPHPVRQTKTLLRNLRMSGSTGAANAADDDGADLEPQQVAFVVRDNLRQRRTIERGYIAAIRAARTSIDLVSPYFYPGRGFRRALRHAAGRGVRVRLLLQGRWDYGFAAMAAHALYEELLGRGVQVHEYTPAFLHAKVCVVDGEWATVGSSNIDPLSLLLNLEANVIVRDADFAAALTAELDEAFAVSRKVAAADATGWLVQVKRAVIARCARLYMRLAGASGRY